MAYLKVDAIYDFNARAVNKSTYYKKILYSLISEPNPECNLWTLIRNLNW